MTTDTMELTSVETMEIRKEIEIAAPIEITFEAVLEELGPGSVLPDGKPFPMKVEPWPGGRWFRDLGSENGHFWGHVQAIKRPTLLEITGPLMMSAPVMSNMQYRLAEADGGTVITFRHTAQELDEAVAWFAEQGQRVLGTRIAQYRKHLALRLEALNHAL